MLALALAIRLSYMIFNRPVVGKTISLGQKSQQTHCYCRIAKKLTKAYEYLLQFQKNIDKKKLYCKKGLIQR